MVLYVQASPIGPSICKYLIISCTGDCDPRQPAVHLQVKKKGKNNGRWFYTCQKDRKQQCSFFMWEDAAQAREKEYLFSGGRQKDESMIRTHIGSSSPPLPEGLLRSSYETHPRLPPQSTPGFEAAGSRGFSLPTVSTGDELDFMSAADAESQRRWDGGQIKEEHEEGAGLSDSRPSVKRKRGPFVGDSDDDEFGGSFGADEEREMLALAETATQSQSQSQSQLSPRRESQQQGGQFTTPSAQRTHDVLHGMPTPHTGTTVGRNRLLIASEQRERDAKRQKLDVPSTPAQPRSGSSNSTVRPPSVPQSSGSGAGMDDYPITEEVMALLGGVPMLDDDVTNTVRHTLNDYALRMKGIERGRDMVRTLVKGKDANIAELQGRVAQLEQQRTADRERIKTLASLVKDMS